MVRSAIESLYKGVCTVFQYEEVTDPVTKRTNVVEVISYENQPCRISFQTKTSAKESDTVSISKQTIKLFISPECDIKSGAKIEVTQNNVTKRYKASGESAMYSNHQEIILEIEDDKA